MRGKHREREEEEGGQINNTEGTSLVVGSNQQIANRTYCPLRKREFTPGSLKLAKYGANGVTDSKREPTIPTLLNQINF